MRHYLRHIHIDRYGAFSDFEVGPFEPGLNVVFGPNEAGKTTAASFVGSVIFGWEDARGVRNTYRSEQGERAGSLVFATAPDMPGSPGAPATLGTPAVPTTLGDVAIPAISTAAGDLATSATATVSRGIDGSGLRGQVDLVSDVDRSIYKTMFSLTSDELRLLRNTSDVTAQLLTAGSGTGSSPSGAFVEIEQRIVSHLSQSEDANASIVRLTRQLEEKRLQIQEAAARNELLKKQDRELVELKRGKEDAAERVDQLNRELERLIAARAELEALDEKSRRCQLELEELARERDEFARPLPSPFTSTSGESRAVSAAPAAPAASQPAPAREVIQPASAPLASASASGAAQPLPSAISEEAPASLLLDLDAAGERKLRERIDEFDEERKKAERIVDVAKENSATSTAAYEALVELDEAADRATGTPGRGSRARRLRNRTTQAAITVVPLLAFIAVGVPLFVHGRQINSLSFTALGAVLIVFALFLAVAAIVVFARPDQTRDPLADRMKDAQWVMLQDKKKLDSSQAQLNALKDEIAAFLAESGLAAANGSLRQALALLDEARDHRALVADRGQRVASLDLRIRSVEEERQAAIAERERIQVESDLPTTATLRDITELVRTKSAQRDALLEVSGDLNLRFGELSRELEQARDDDAFGRLKLEAEQIRTRLRESKHELVVLLLAKRMLERSIAAWESSGQPEVYAEASRLLALITDGKWVRVSMSSSGSIEAIAADGTSRKPRHLSLGTCQQVYLALRIALLLSAENVGRAIPVLADDILVNFDAPRRQGAARALAQLAEKRQVILFTSHEETVAALREASPTLNEIAL